MDNVNHSDLNEIISNRTIVATALFSFITYIAVIFRFGNIGISSRDLIQLFLVICVIVLAFYRNKLANNHKNIAIISILFLGGISGAMSLGLIAGTILLFPTVFIIFSTNFSKKTTLIYTLSVIVTLAVIAISFKTSHLSQSTLTLSYDYFHWTVYIGCMLFCFFVSGVIIYTYRDATQKNYLDLRESNEQLKITNEKLESALKEVQTLNGLLPICSYCKKIRDDKGYWSQLEAYIAHNSSVQFSHGICEECLKKHHGDEF